MLTYAIRRLLASIPTLLVLVTVIFIGIRLIPGGPAVAVLGPNATAERIAALEQRMGLDRPILHQYAGFLWGLVRGDLGRSMTLDRSISDQLRRALPLTIELTVASTLLSVIIGLPLGILSARRRDTIWDTLSRLIALLGISVPNFLLGILLLMAFSLHWNIFPIMGAGSWADPIGRLGHLFLPALALGFSQAAIVTRVTRAAILEVVALDYIRTAHAKGLQPWLVFRKHALRNALIPILTVVGLDMGRQFGGTVVVEVVFTRPGVGALLVGAVAQRDYTVLQSGILIFGVFIIVTNLIVDLCYAFVDPRVQYS